jgi:hypothetical protein
MKRIFKAFTFNAFIFGIFVPYGYLPWYWAIPTSMISFGVLAHEILEEYEKGKAGKDNAGLKPPLTPV